MVNAHGLFERCDILSLQPEEILEQIASYKAELVEAMKEKPLGRATKVEAQKGEKDLLTAVAKGGFQRARELRVHIIILSALKVALRCASGSDVMTEVDGADFSVGERFQGSQALSKLEATY